MSFEIDWQSLSPLLATTLTKHLNRILQATPSPSFLDPIVVQSIDFGDNAPEVQLIDIRDISRAFSKANAQTNTHLPKVVGPNCDSSARSTDPRHSPGPDGCFLSPPRAPSISTSFDTNQHQPLAQASHDYRSFHSNEQDLLTWRNGQLQGVHDPQLSGPEAQATSSSKPSLELHLKVTYSGNMRIDLSTALVLNYPSPLFMSLPVKMRVVGFVFAAEVVLAIEADRCRCHCTIFEPEPSAEEEAGDEFYPDQLTPGARIIPEMLIHTEVGNADKHVLRNVGKVERFLVETLRRIICDELLFPTFQTFDWS
ncbi:hypothetical protein CROQUDRAFT_89253 [Cronartium quercuum f. sp. fusiforme G11]|uniref:Mitochondrial distribution and morphology protein 12 n=1 Tax=Cronartium quercuum f. sp. fusiforme G11 TaxID=708437 RepID=A0A9P6TF67_9BASI|nr:hypothetical protein CROQUDRAFT_89253 [Cronartium quercuum f. sp. fusiforme G11]